jgi:hypothetical protein
VNVPGRHELTDAEWALPAPIGWRIDEDGNVVLG